MKTRRSAEQIVGLFRQADVELGKGLKAPVVCRHLGISEQKYYRWHVEQWFERAKREAGLGAFEVRTYTGLIRHWLCVRLAMMFLAEQTTRLRGE
jgi:hypothetical protein